MMVLIDSACRAVTFLKLRINYLLCFTCETLTQLPAFMTITPKHIVRLKNSTIKTFRQIL